MKEIGSFIGLDLGGTQEFYNNELGMTRLNSARSGIYHACQLYNIQTIYLPYYLPPSLNEFLTKHGINTIKYHINKQFEPINIKQKKNSAVIIVNYFGIISQKKMKNMAEKYRNVIINNSAAFYSPPLEGCYTIYSPRKFFGVPDGSYVLGHNASRNTHIYAQDKSAETSSFLFTTIEQGTNATYNERMRNEARIDNSGPMRMSDLTHRLLKNIDYKRTSNKRVENFKYAHFHFNKTNKLNPMLFFDSTCVPMVYPLVVERENLDQKLREKKVYVGRLWTSLLPEVPHKSFEAWMSKFMIPIPIDQRYGRQEINMINNYITDILM